jgi:hypothetical protein
LKWEDNASGDVQRAGLRQASRDLAVQLAMTLDGKIFWEEEAPDAASVAEFPQMFQTGNGMPVVSAVWSGRVAGLFGEPHRPSGMIPMNFFHRVPDSTDPLRDPIQVSVDADSGRVVSVDGVSEGNEGIPEKVFRWWIPTQGKYLATSGLSVAAAAPLASSSAEEAAVDGVAFWLETLITFSVYALAGGDGRLPAIAAASLFYALLHVRHVVRDARTGALRSEWIWEDPAPLRALGGYFVKGLFFHFAPLLLGAPAWMLAPWALISHKVFLAASVASPAPDRDRRMLLERVFPKSRFLAVEGQVKGMVPLTDARRGELLARASSDIAAEAAEDAWAGGAVQRVHITELFGTDPTKAAERAALGAFVAAVLSRAGAEGRVDLFVKDPSVGRAAVLGVLPPTAAALAAAGRLKLWLASEPQGRALFKDGKISERAVRDEPLLGAGRAVALHAVHPEDVLRDADGGGIDLLPLLGALVHAVQSVEDALKAMRLESENA